MNETLLQRATVVLDRVTAERLTAISDRMGVSRSALVRDVLAEPIELMHRWIAQLPEQPTHAEVEALQARIGDDVESFLDSKASQLALLDEVPRGNA